ncbi:MAG: MmgE/PrpD family protein [Rhodomicrobium sp.]
MAIFARRDILRASAAAGVTATVAPPLASAAEGSPGSGSQPPATGAASPPPPAVTQFLARKIVEARYEDIPAAVRREAVRTFLNWTGCAIGGSHHETISIALSALRPFAGPAQATLLGRVDRIDIMHAAFLNGASSHVFDFDDTHLKTIIHPGGPVASALLAYAEYAPVNGKDFINALVLGVETECRLGNSVYPSHYALGWHITGTCGVFGAAAAVGKLLGLDEKQMAYALGVAATQQTGLKIMFGSMTKSFHPGRAAESGMLAALLAAKGFTSSDKAIEGKDGWGGAVSPKQNWAEVVEGWGSRYEAALNTYKPFACGIVTHPAIDGTIQLRNEHRLTAEQIDRIELDVHPLVLSLTGKTEPQTGLEGKFSIYHIAAISLVQGKAGEKQFSDDAVRDPVIVSLRKKVTAAVDPSIKEDQARIKIVLRDARVVEKFIEHAVGSTTNPMSDQMLEAKFTDLAEGILPSEQTRRLIEMCWRVEELPSAGAIAQAAAAVA